MQHLGLAVQDDMKYRGRIYKSRDCKAFLQKFHLFASNSDHRIPTTKSASRPSPCIRVSISGARFCSVDTRYRVPDATLPVESAMESDLVADEAGKS
jgi:hypothetical protein